MSACTGVHDRDGGCAGERRDAAHRVTAGLVLAVEHEVFEARLAAFDRLRAAAEVERLHGCLGGLAPLQVLVMVVIVRVHIM